MVSLAAPAVDTPTPDYVVTPAIDISTPDGEVAQAIESPIPNYVAAETPHAQQASAVQPHKARSLLRTWYAIRWQLARSVFARPPPFLTRKRKLKVGDLLITWPAAAAAIAINGVACKNHDVSGSGTVPMIVLIVVFVLTVRNNSVLLFLAGLPYERALSYHKLFGGVAWVVTGLHGLAYLLRENEDNGRRLRQLRSSDEPILSREFSGALAFYALSALLAFTFKPIRRHFYEFFLRTHWIFFILIVVFSVIHGAGLILIGFVPWAIDMLYRYGILAPSYARKNGGIHSSQVTLKLVAKDIVRVRFPRPQPTSFKYEAGQFVYLCFPQVARLEWHPFTIASAPHEPYVTVYIKVLGDWTKRLATFAASARAESTPMLVDGPYGAVSIEMDHYSHFVFVSGGIGVTPMMSLANDLYHASKTTNSRRKFVEKVWFVWAVRDREVVQALMLDESDGLTAKAEEHTPSWLPHVLTSASNTNSPERDAFVADFYLTNKDQDLSESVDQRLSLCLKHKQRPDLAKILREVGECAKRSKSVGSKGPVRVAVLACGPNKMLSEVVKQSRQLSTSLGVVFDVHQETFGW